ncbi:MAG TPA: ABC transporter permease [Kiritimatiellia bacterium]|nr:ABC transporter permease [Kiritimatiellia bacterium]HRZ11467.1 ABC transporter permease [Kiritimatiellia bacterium]HSA16982.1 ABC transporter permease [Kiritimatiellia bacterium]
MSAPLLTVYESSNTDRLSISAWREMLAEFWSYRELTWRLMSRNFAAQFRQSFLGYLWVILPPVATTIVFALLRQAQIVNVPMAEGAMPYVLFALMGTTVWGFFTQVTITTTHSVAGAGNLVSRIYFPREVLAVSSALNAVINLCIRLVVLALTFALARYVPHWQVVFAPLLLVPLMALAMGLGLLFAPVNTMMDDMGRMLDFAFQFGLFLAPTVYPTPRLADITGKWELALFWIHSLNPVSHFLHAMQSLVETGTFDVTRGLVVSTILSFLALAAGWRFFHICEPLLAERL